MQKYVRSAIDNRILSVLMLRIPAIEGGLRDNYIPGVTEAQRDKPKSQR